MDLEHQTIELTNGIDLNKCLRTGKYTYNNENGFSSSGSLNASPSWELKECLSISSVSIKPSHSLSENFAAASYRDLSEGWSDHRLQFTVLSYRIEPE